MPEVRFEIAKRLDLSKFLKGRSDDDVDDFVARAAFEVEREAKHRCPVDTGRLRASLGAAPVRRKTWKVAAGTDYAAHVEYGTKHAGGQPYLRPAVQEVRQRLETLWRRGR